MRNKSRYFSYPVFRHEGRSWWVLRNLAYQTEPTFLVCKSTYAPYVTAQYLDCGDARFKV